MIKAVLDTTVLISAFLNANPGGAAFDLLSFAKASVFELCISDEILTELSDVLLSSDRIRRKFRYSDALVDEFCGNVRTFALRLRDVPEIRGAVARDPKDDMIVACALAASAQYIVTRDKDLLSLGRHDRIEMISPEDFLHVLREGGAPEPPGTG